MLNQLTSCTVLQALMDRYTNFMGSGYKVYKVHYLQHEVRQCIRF